MHQFIDSLVHLWLSLNARTPPPQDNVPYVNKRPSLPQKATLIVTQSYAEVFFCGLAPFAYSGLNAKKARFDYKEEYFFFPVCPFQGQMPLAELFK